MTEKAMPSNRHPVDQLGTIRATIKALEAREAELKQQILDMLGPDDCIGGDEYIAFKRNSVRKGSLDPKALMAAGINPDRYRKDDITVQTLVVELRAPEAA